MVVSRREDGSDCCARHVRTSAQCSHLQELRARCFVIDPFLVELAVLDTLVAFVVLLELIAAVSQHLIYTWPIRFRNHRLVESQHPGSAVLMVKCGGLDVTPAPGLSGD